MRKVRIEGCLHNAETNYPIECPLIRSTDGRSGGIACGPYCAWFERVDGGEEGGKRISFAICQNGNENCTIGELVD